MTQVAFVGIGAMGEFMAANLLRKDFALTVVQHRRAEPAARLQGAGAMVRAIGLLCVSCGESSFAVSPFLAASLSGGGK